MSDDLKGVVAELAERVEAVEEQLHEERDRRREAEARVEELEERVEEVHEKRITASENAGRERAELFGRMSSVEEAVDAVDAVAGADDPGRDLDRDDLTPMEQIARLPEHIAADQFDNPSHRNTYRARSIFRDFADYSEKTPRGRLVWNRDLTRVLTAQEDGGKVETNTGRRVMDRIVELSKGAFVREKRKGEHVLVLDDRDALGGSTDAVVS